MLMSLKLQNKPFHNEAFGYTLWEKVEDPDDQNAPRAIAMHVPAGGMSKVWQLVEPGYSETIELFGGEGKLVHFDYDDLKWRIKPLTPENPTANGTVLRPGDMFCVVALESILTLSRPSRPFDISFESDVTSSPADPLSRFVVTLADL